MGLISIGIDHEHASLDLLERATVTEDQWGKVLRALVAHRNIHEAVFVSTCLRTEVIAVIDLFHGAIEDVTTTLAEVTGLDRSEFEHSLTVHFDRGVPQHLFSVAAGLKSVVPGEFEILGQLRRALEVATEENTAGPEVTELFQRALAAGRHVRSETSIARGTTSFAQASVTLANEQVGAGMKSAAVLVVGAGQLASGIAKSVLSGTDSCESLTIANRTLSKANDLCRELGDDRVRACSLDEISTLANDVRIIFTAVETTQPAITREMLETISNPLLVIDLGMPRAVAHDVDEITLVTRVDISDLRERVDQALEGRREALVQAEALVTQDVDKYLADVRARGASTIVSELRARFDEVIEAELARREPDLADLSPEQREKVASIVRGAVAKIAHKPTVALKEAAGTDRGLRLSDATRHLFDL